MSVWSWILWEIKKGERLGLNIRAGSKILTDMLKCWKTCWVAFNAHFTDLSQSCVTWKRVRHIGWVAAHWESQKSGVSQMPRRCNGFFLDRCHEHNRRNIWEAQGPRSLNSLAQEPIVESARTQLATALMSTSGMNEPENGSQWKLIAGVVWRSFILSGEDDGVADGPERARVKREGVEAHGAVPTTAALSVHLRRRMWRGDSTTSIWKPGFGLHSWTTKLRWGVAKKISHLVCGVPARPPRSAFSAPTAAVGPAFADVGSGRNHRVITPLGERIHHASLRWVTVLAENGLSIGGTVLVCNPVVQIVQHVIAIVNTSSILICVLYGRRKPTRWPSLNVA